MKLTAARKRALEAVRDGKCFRRYMTTGNSMHGPEGVSAQTLWHLERAGLIGDARGGGVSRVQLALTMRGAGAIAPTGGRRDG